MPFSNEKRALKRPRLGPPDVYPQEPKQKEVCTLLNFFFQWPVYIVNLYFYCSILYRDSNIYCSVYFLNCRMNLLR